MDLHDLVANVLILVLLALVLYFVASIRAGGAIDVRVVSKASPLLVLIVLIFAFAALSAALLAIPVLTGRNG